MDADRIEKLADQIYERFKDYGVSRSEILRRLKLLILEFMVDESEAIRTVTNYIAKEYAVPKEEVTRESPLVKIAEINEPNMWVSVKAKVVQLWEPNSPSISQTGLAGDETGFIRFTVWAKAEKPRVEEGKSYLFKNVVSDVYAGRRWIKVTRNSDIIEIEEDIELPPRELEIVGALVAIQQNSGLIQRCVECGRVVKKGVCPVHGKVEWRDDLRVKGVLDDGKNTYEIILNEDNIRDLTGIDLERARRLAEESLDRGAVLSELKKLLIGKYLRVTGVKGERYLLVRKVDFYKADVKKMAEELLAELRGG